MCGQVYKLKELKREIFNRRFTGFLVCCECWDEDHPQLQLGRFPINDPQALENPRTDAGREDSRVMWGWNPVGNQAIQMLAVTGYVSVNGQLTQGIFYG